MSGTGLIMVAGTLTFGNEWVQTGTPNWRIPIATLGSALLFSGLNEIAPKASTALGVIVLIAAVTVRFNGKSVVEEALTVLPSGPNPLQGKKVKK